MKGKKKAFFIHITLTRQWNSWIKVLMGEKNHYACLLTLLKANCIKIIIYAVNKGQVIWADVSVTLCLENFQ